MARTRAAEQSIASWSDVWNFVRAEVSDLIGRPNRREIALIAVGIAAGILLTVLVGAVGTQLFANVGEPLVP